MPEYSGKILIIDDEINICKMLNMFFEQGGYEVEFTSDPAKALPLFKKFSPDIVLLDIMMPGVNGIDVLKSIKKVNDAAKVIIISGLHDIALAKEAVKYGAIDYFQSLLNLTALRAGFRCN